MPRKAKRRVGRPSKLDRGIADRAVLAIRLGAPFELAGLYAGIRRETITKWVRRGDENPKGEYGEFARRVKEAEGKAVVGCLARIRDAAEREWQAAAWLLERRYPEQFGRMFHKVEMTGKDGKPLAAISRVNVIAITDPERLRQVAELAQQLGLLPKLIEAAAAHVVGGNGSGNGNGNAALLSLPRDGNSKP